MEEDEQVGETKDLNNQEDEEVIDKEQDDEDNNYYKIFVNEMRRKNQLEQIEKETNQVNFDEDDDKFIIGL